MSTKTRATHTPGPWQDGSLGLVTDCSGPEPIYSRQIALVKARQYPDYTAEEKANLRLIAAAPSLLKALEGVLRVADRATDEFDAARAALARARGE